MRIIKLRGIVLNEIKKGEADKQLTLFTFEEGKVHVYAKGARKLKSRYFSGTSQFDYSEFVVFSGRNFYSLSQVNKIEGFKSIAVNYDKLCYGNYFLEMIDKTTYTGAQNIEIFKLLLYSLKALEQEITENICICRAFEFKYMQINGYCPDLSYCSECGKRFFDAKELFLNIDGALCKACVSPSAYRINQAAFDCINYILNSDIKNIFSFRLDATSKKIMCESSNLLMQNMDVFLNSKSFIHNIEN